MPVSKETLQKLLAEFDGLEMSDEELNEALPVIQYYLDGLDCIKQLDLSSVIPARLPRINPGD